MDFLEILKAVLIGIIQGITEWLPISSTGHMILADEFIKLNITDEFKEMFLVVIQFGSILAVVYLYFHKLNPFSQKKSKQEKKESFLLWLKVLVAILPAGVIGVLYDDKIDKLFFNSKTVAVTLVVYGILFILLENRKQKPRVESFSDLSYKTAFLIGLFQILSLIPGTSRSGTTILGAVFLGTSRYIAAEFSFFLAIPIMFGASLLKLAKYGIGFSASEWSILITGIAVAFVVSVFAIKFLIGYIKKHDFKAFGYYRIVLGITLIILYFFKIII